MKPAEVRKALAEINRCRRDSARALRLDEKRHAQVMNELLRKEKQIMAKCEHNIGRKTFYCTGCHQTSREMAGYQD